MGIKFLSTSAFAYTLFIIWLNIFVDMAWFFSTLISTSVDMCMIIGL